MSRCLCSFKWLEKQHFQATFVLPGVVCPFLMGVQRWLFCGILNFGQILWSSVWMDQMLCYTSAFSGIHIFNHSGDRNKSQRSLRNIRKTIFLKSTFTFAMLTSLQSPDQTHFSQTSQTTAWTHFLSLNYQTKHRSNIHKSSFTLIFIHCSILPGQPCGISFRSMRLSYFSGLKTPQETQKLSTSYTSSSVGLYSTA